MIPESFPRWPDAYLHVKNCRSGEEYAMRITARAKLDLTRLVKRWIQREFGGELRLDGKIMPRLEGEFYAQIMTDGRPPDSVVVWDSGGFFITAKE